MHRTRYMVMAVLVAAIFLSVLLFNRLTRQQQAAAVLDSYTALNGQERPGHPGVQLPSVNFAPGARVQELTAQQVADRENGIIFFGFPTCPWCRNSLPLVLEAVNSTGQTLLYCQLDQYRDAFTLQNGIAVQTTAPGEGYQLLLQRLDAWLEDYTLTDAKGVAVPTGEKRLYAPTLVVLEKGEVAAFWTLESVPLTLQDSQTEYDPWTAAQQTAVRESLQALKNRDGSHSPLTILGMV